MILQPDAEPARHHDHRLVGETHALGKRGAVALHQIGAFVDIKADPVAGAMGKTRQIIVGTKAVADQHVAGGLVDRFARRADGSGVEGSLLGLLFDMPELLGAAVQFGQRIGASDIGIIAVDGAAGVDQDQLPVLQLGVAWHAMRMRGRLAELDGAKAVAAVSPAGAVQAIDFGNYFAGLHARLDPLEDRLMDRESELHRRDHQVDFLL